MKIFKLLLLLVIGIHSENILHIPKSISIGSLHRIIKHGWDESNSTHQAFIATMSQKRIDHYLVLIKKPLHEVKPTTKDPFPIPKILLNRNDYTHLLAYCKYLESLHRDKESLDIHNEILEGLNMIKNTSMLSIIFRTVIEKMCVQSIHTVINKLTFSQKEKVHLKNKLDKLLIQDIYLLREAMKQERLTTIAGLKDRMLSSENNLTNIDFAKRVIEKVNKITQKYNKHIFNIKSKRKLLTFQKEEKLEKEKFLAKYTQWEKGKFKKPLKGSTVDFVAYRLFFESKPNTILLILDTQDNIKENKRLLEILEKP